MNRRLSETRIRVTCRELFASQERVSGRALCAELRRRFGAVGKTERVFAIWREELGTRLAPVDAAKEDATVAELERRLAAAETAAAENLGRAERAELRERAHQEKWAMEVDKLREHVRAQPNYAAEIRGLQEQVTRLTVELHALRAALREVRRLVIDGHFKYLSNQARVRSRASCAFFGLRRPWPSPG